MAPVPVQIAMTDAFTRTPGAGNRAGVVQDGRALDVEIMCRIARAVGASETAFVVDPTASDIKLRFFTPKEEIPFCGHATVAAVVRLFELGRVRAPSQIEVHTQAGAIPVEIEIGEGGTPRVWMKTPLAKTAPAPLSSELIIDLMRARREALVTRFRPFACGGQMFLALETRRDLFALAPRWDALAEAGDAHGIRGFYAFTLDVLDRHHLWHGRYFAPLVGVREDPVTGSAIAPLARYLAEQGVMKLPKDGGTVRSSIEQGDAMGKPGRADIEVVGMPDEIERVRVGGHAVTAVVGDLYP